MNGKAILKLKKRPEKTDYAKRGWNWLTISIASYLIFFWLESLLFNLNSYSSRNDVIYDWAALLLYSYLTIILILASYYFIQATIKAKWSYLIVSLICLSFTLVSIWGALMSFSR